MERFYKFLTFCSVLFAAIVGKADQSVVISDKLTPQKCCIDLFSPEVALKFEVMFLTGKYDFKPVGALKQTVLHYAAVENNAHQVQKCLELGADVNAKNCLGRTPLTALLSSTYELSNKYKGSSSIRSVDFSNVVDILLRHGADVNDVDNVGKTAIDYAIFQGNLNVVKNLIKRGAKLPTNRPGWDGILAEDTDYSPEMIQFLIDHGANVNGNLQGAPLLSQIMRNNWSGVKYLIDAGADLNATGVFCDTPVHLAAGKGSLEMTKLLAERGADLFAKDMLAHSVLHDAVRGGSVQVVQWLIDQALDVNAKNVLGELPIDKVFTYKPATSLNKRELKKTVELVNLLLDNGSFVGNESLSNRNLIITAYRCNDQKLFKRLIKLGVNVKDAFRVNDLVDLRNRLSLFDVLDYLANQQKTELQKKLFKYILVQVKASDKEKKDLFDKAASLEKYKLANLLFESWKNVLNPHLIYISNDDSAARFDKDLFLRDVIIVDLRTNDIKKRYRKPERLSPDQVQWLTDRGADPCLPGECGRNFLFKAVESYNLELIKYVVKQGADINVKDEEGQTLLFFTPNWKMTKYLIDAGVDVAVQNSSGNNFFNGNKASYYYNDITLNQFKYIYSLLKDDIQDESKFFSDAIDVCRVRMQIAHWLVKQGFDLKTLNNKAKAKLINAAITCPCRKFNDKSDKPFAAYFSQITHLINQIDFFRAPKSPTEQGLALALCPVQWEALSVIFQTAKIIKDDILSDHGLPELRFLIHYGLLEKKESVNNALKTLIANLDNNACNNEFTLPVIQALLDLGADVNLSGDVEMGCTRISHGTLLDFALRRGNLEMTQDLIRRGAFLDYDELSDPDLRESVYQCPNPVLINWLVRKPVCLYYIKGSPDVFVKNALLADNYHWLQVLQNHGFNMKKVLDKYSDVIFSEIILRGSPLAIQWLVDHGVDVNGTGIDDEPFIYYAVANDRLAAVKTLVKCGANLKVVVINKSGTIAHAAAQSRNLEIVKVLADNGVDFNALDSYGNAPIHVAAGEYHNVLIIEYLLNHGADVNAKNNDGETPLDIAKRESRDDAVEFLNNYLKKKQSAERIQD
ncbi:MAG: ankyrin repeat domain-containing protein [Thermoguttaceae bacterium]|nr:ankyrin repeat domain-containing protein [Thermoguttaceae bacterium]